MTTAYLGLGSNVGDRLANLQRAVMLLAEHASITAVSPVFETEPVGFADQAWFLNAAVGVETVLSPEELLAIMRSTESAMGKATPFHNGPRNIDIDLLLYGDTVLETPDLLVPHPRMAQRRFVLVPLAEVAPKVAHPVLHVTIAEMLDRLPPGEHVRPFGRLGA